MDRTREALFRRAATSASKKAESAKCGVWANRRSIAGSNSSADMGCAPDCNRPRLEPGPKFIQTTLDMRFHRSKRQIHGRGDFRVRQPRAMTQGDAQAFGLAEAPQGFVQIDAADAVDGGRGVFRFGFRHIARLPGDTLQIETRGDALDPGGEGALAPELGAFLE